MRAKISPFQLVVFDLRQERVKLRNDLVNFGVKKLALITVKNCALFERITHFTIMTNRNEEGTLFHYQRFFVLSLITVFTKSGRSILFCSAITLIAS